MRAASAVFLPVKPPTGRTPHSARVPCASISKRSTTKRSNKPFPRRISLTDPQSRWTAAPGGPAFFAYSKNYLIDTEHGVILDVEATPAHRTAEVDSTKTMVDRVEERFDITPERLICDTAYGMAPMLAWMVQDKGIEPHVPVWDKTQRKDDSLSSNDFEWMARPTNIVAPRAMHCAASGACSRSNAIMSPRRAP